MILPGTCKIRAFPGEELSNNLPLPGILEYVFLRIIRKVREEIIRKVYAGKRVIQDNLSKNILVRRRFKYYFCGIRDLVSRIGICNA